MRACSLNLVDTAGLDLDVTCRVLDTLKINLRSTNENKIDLSSTGPFWWRFGQLDPMHCVVSMSLQYDYAMYNMLQDKLCIDVGECSDGSLRFS